MIKQQQIFKTFIKIFTSKVFSTEQECCADLKKATDRVYRSNIEMFVKISNTETIIKQHSSITFPFPLMKNLPLRPFFPEVTKTYLHVSSSFEKIWPTFYYLVYLTLTGTQEPWCDNTNESGINREKEFLSSSHLT